MFEKLFMLVKNNAGTAVIDNPAIASKDRDAVMIDASSAIIEVFKNQIESGRIKEVIKFFKFSGVYSSSLITSVVNRFSNKLNTYYNLDPKAAYRIAADLIPGVLQQMVALSKEGKDEAFALGTMLSNLNGNRTDLGPMVNSLMVA